MGCVRRRHLVAIQPAAAANGIGDPFDPRVVEAYWLGNELLERVDGIVSPGADWPVRVAAVVTVLTYVLAGIAKLRIGGVAWMTGDTLRNHVAFSANGPQRRHDARAEPAAPERFARSARHSAIKSPNKVSKFPVRSNKRRAASR